MCQNCNDHHDFPILPINLVEPDCFTPCSTTPICKKKISAKCVMYEGPPLTGLGLGTNVDVETVLYTLSLLLQRCNPCGNTPCVCNAPADFNVDKNTTGLAPGSYRIVLTWSPVTGANGYTIEYKISNTNNWIILNQNAQGTSNSTLIVSLGSDSTRSYDFRIKSNCNNCESVYMYKNNVSVCVNCPSITEFTVTS